MRSLVMPLLLLAVVVRPATPATAASRLAVPEIPFEKTTLPNGMQLVLHVDRKLPLVHVNLWYHVGSDNEKPGHTGFAHLFEHMMLQGSKNASQDFFTLMQRAGARPGRDSNGTTSTDRTNYFSTAPSGSLEYLLWVHSDLLATLLDGLTQAKLDNQRAVVRNERRERMDNAPYGRWYKLLSENLFPTGHPYSWPVIGSHEDLAAASLEDVKAFFRTFYTPNNLSLVVTGDFDPATAKRLVSKYFGTIAPGPALDRPPHWIPRLDGEKVVEVSDRVPLERLFVGWPAPEIGGADEPDLNLAAAILSDGLSSRLQKTLVYDRKLASAVSSFNDPNEIAGQFVVDVTARPGAPLGEIERLTTAEIARLAKQGPTAAELERARTKQLTDLAATLQNMGAFGGKADILNYYNVYFRDPGYLKADVQRILRVTPASLRAAVARWLDTRNRVVLRFHPERSERTAATDLDRTRAPKLGADNPFKVPPVSADKLPNGLELYTVERHELPVVTIALVSRAAAVLDPPGKEGLASLVDECMQRGTRSHGAVALADAFGDLGTTLDGNVGPEQASLFVQVQSANAGRALALLAEVARNPTFPPVEVERELKIRGDRIERQEKDPQALAGRLMGLLAFGAGHPYARPRDGYRRTVAALTAQDLAAFHARYWKPGGAALMLVGDITAAQARTLATKELGGWTGAMPPAPPVPPPAPLRKVVIADRPDAAQTTVVHVYGAPAHKGEDYYAWRLASDVLGGGVAGRLSMNLRQDKGYSYGVFARTELLSSAMAWTGEGAVQTDKTRESVIEFVKELQGLAGARPIAPQELEDARLGLLRNYAAGFGTNNDVINRLALLWGRRWPMEELEREPEGLARAPLAEVQAAARRYAVPAQAGLLLVGDRAKIEAGVRALKLGEVLVVDAEGRPLPGH
jgi:zinc protease